MATLRLKCVVNSVRRVANESGGISQEEIGLNAVYADKGVNKQWSKWTPCASLTMTVSNPDAFNRVLPGQHYYVDLIETTKDDPIV